MPVGKARRLCADLIIVKSRMAAYRSVSKQVFSIFSEYSPLVESLSLDEAFIDISGTQRLLGSPLRIGRQLKEAVLDKTGLVVSVGIGPNKFIAKIASAHDKPDGLVEVKPENIRRFLDPLSISKLFGVGEKAKTVLEAIGIRTIAALRAQPLAVLEHHLGASLGQRLSQLATGIDDRHVEPHRQRKSIGQEITFDSDLMSFDILCGHLLSQCDQVASRLRSQGLRTKCIVLKLKTPDFKLHTKRLRFEQSTRDAKALYDAAVRLLRRMMGTVQSVRLAGVSVTDFEEKGTAQQLSFDHKAHEDGENIGDVIDAVQSKYGKSLLKRASTLTNTDQLD